LFYDSGGSLLASGINNPIAVTDSTWTQVTTSGMAPTGTASVRVIVSTTGTPYSVAGQSIYIDDIIVRSVTYTATLSVANSGDADSAPVYTITGAATNPTITNNASSSSLRLSTTVASSNVVTVDAGAREIYAGTSLSAASNLYSTKAATSSFPLAIPGTNPFTFSAPSGDANTLLGAAWRDAWMP
jgi:phage-related protein